jgi:hypothetical protein
MIAGFNARGQIDGTSTIDPPIRFPLFILGVAERTYARPGYARRHGRRHLRDERSR